MSKQHLQHLQLPPTRPDSTPVPMRNTALPSTDLPWCLHGPHSPFYRSHGHGPSALDIHSSLRSVQYMKSRASRILSPPTPLRTQTVTGQQPQTTSTPKTWRMTCASAPERLSRVCASHAYSVHNNLTRGAAEQPCMQPYWLSSCTHVKVNPAVIDAHTALD